MKRAREVSMVSTGKQCFSLCEFLPLGGHLLAGIWELGPGLPHYSSSFEGRASREWPIFIRSLGPMAERGGFNLQYVMVAGPNMPVWEGLQRQSSEGLSQNCVCLVLHVKCGKHQLFISGTGDTDGFLGGTGRFKALPLHLVCVWVESHHLFSSPGFYSKLSSSCFSPRSLRWALLMNKAIERHDHYYHYY